MGEQKQWRSEIQHGPDGETDYAWVHDEKDTLVCVARTHHANAIVRAVNTYPAVADLVEALECADEWLSGWASADPYLARIRSALNRFHSFEAGKGGDQ